MSVSFPTVLSFCSHFAGDINSLATYAGIAALDDAHPRANQLRAAFPNAKVVAASTATMKLEALPTARQLRLAGARSPLAGQEYIPLADKPDSGEAAAKKPIDASRVVDSKIAELTATSEFKEVAFPAKTPLEALDEVTPLSPVSPADARRAVSWSIRSGAKLALPHDPGQVALSKPSPKGGTTIDLREAAQPTTFADMPREDDVASCAEHEGVGDVSTGSKQAPVDIKTPESSGHFKASDDTAMPDHVDASATTDIRLARAEQKAAKSTLWAAAREAKVAWRDARKEAVLKAPIRDDHFSDLAMLRVESATNAALRAEERLGESLAAESYGLMRSHTASLSMRWYLQLGPARNREDDDDSRLTAAIAVRNRLQRIFRRWIEEFEKAQMTTAMSIWRVAVWELRREDTWAEYRRSAAAARVEVVLKNHRRRSMARAFAKLVSRTGWLIFADRYRASLAIQSIYRMRQGQRYFVARHDLQSINGAYADIALASPRKTVRFFIDSRVRLERRGFWSAATRIQTLQRRNSARGYYVHAKKTSTQFMSLFRMWVVRRHYVLMRRSAILIEACIRALVAHRPFCRACAATRQLQRVVRGHVGRTRAYTRLLQKRQAFERYASAPRIIQQVWRGSSARRRVAAIRAEIADYHWAGVRLQLAWYRRKGFFPTFVLVSCLRVTDEEDKESAAQIRLVMRKMAARRISIYYLRHRRIVHKEAALRIACAWRRSMATSEVLHRRRATWARRKLRHFAKARMRHRHASSKRIAFCFWRSRPGRLLRHIEHRLAVEERLEEAEEARVRDLAATTIQAIIHGQLTRRRLRHESAVLKLQLLMRRKLAYLRVGRRSAERKADFAETVVRRTMRASIFAQLNTYRRGLHKYATRLEARARGWLARSILSAARRYARDITVAAATLQRSARRRHRYLVATRAVMKQRRTMASMFKECASFEQVLSKLSECGNLPNAAHEAWLWYEIDDACAGVGPHAVCRRAGTIEALGALGRRISSLRALAMQSARRSTSVRRLSAEASNDLQSASAHARATVARVTNGTLTEEQRRLLDESAPLTDRNDRRRAALLVCALSYAGLSQRQVDALPSLGDIATLVKFDKLPFPCRKLVSAWSDDDVFSNGDAPRDLSRAMMRRFCSSFQDADKALRALRSNEFARSPWTPDNAEIEHDKERVRVAFETRRHALEQLRIFMEERDSDFASKSKLGQTIAGALADGEFAINVATSRSVEARKRSERASRREYDGLSGSTYDSQVTSTSSHPSTATRSSSGQVRNYGPDCIPQHSDAHASTRRDSDTCSFGSRTTSSTVKEHLSFDEATAEGKSPVSQRARASRIASDASQRRIQRTSTTLDSSVEDPANVGEYLAELRCRHPAVFDDVSLEDILTVVPGIECSELSFALAVVNVVYTRALRVVSEYSAAAKSIFAAMRSRLSRRLMASMRHAHAVMNARRAYFQERSGEALRLAWQQDMKAYQEAKLAEERALDVARKQDEDRRRISTVLRLGWRACSIRKGSLQAALFADGDDQLSRGALVKVFERERPRKPKPVHRDGVVTYPKHRDDDEARDAGVARVVVESEETDDPDAWEAKERERTRAVPLYDIADDAAALTVQTAYRSIAAVYLVERTKRDKARRAREARERAEWERRQQERLRYVTVRFDLEVQQSPLVRSAGSSPKDDEDDDVVDELSVSPFERGTDFKNLERGLHVLARFGEIGPEHWYSGTIFDDSRGDVFGIVFDDGDVDTNVPRGNIMVPKISPGTRVEARYNDGDEFFEASVLSVATSGRFFKVSYYDGDVEPSVSRTKLRVLDIETLADVEFRRKKLLAVEAKKRTRREAADRRRKDDIDAGRKRLDELRERFDTARTVSLRDEVMRRHRELDAESMPPDPHALALLDMAVCSRGIRELTRPRYVVALRIDYTRVALRYGWEEVAGKGTVYFSHTSSGRTAWERPAYTFDDESAARRVQCCYRAACRRRDLDQALGSSHLPTLISETRLAAARAGWTPTLSNGDERAPLELWMARRGFDMSAIDSVLRRTRRQVAKTLSAKLANMNEGRRLMEKRKAIAKANFRVLQRFRQISFNAFAVGPCDSEISVSSESTSAKSKATSSTGDRLREQQLRDEKQLEALGLTNPIDRRWLRSTTDDAARFLAFWNSPLDERSMRDVLKQAKATYARELERSFKNQKTRCHHMAEALSKSRFPVTVGQIQRIVSEFAGKPSAAQEAINARFVDVPTTSTQPRELEALAAFRAGSKRARQIAARMKLDTLVTRCDEALRTADAICVDEPQQRGQRQSLSQAARSLVRRASTSGEESVTDTSGPAARASWILDDEVLGTAQAAWRGAVRAQAHCRRRLATESYQSLVDSRTRAAIRCQLAWRAGLARRVAEVYRAQQRADWQMLWDESAQAFYFLRASTAEVSWEEPSGGETSFRPQVKDRFTGRLVQAWPQLDQPKPLHLQQPRPGYCMQCKIEEATRRCLSCAAPKFEGRAAEWGDGFYHFCFSCFATHHDGSPEMRAHDFDITKDTTAPALRCCVCSDLATRRCLGLKLRPRGRRVVDRFLVQHAVRAADASIQAPPTQGASVLESVTPSKLREVLRRAGIPMSVARVEVIDSQCRAGVNSSDEDAVQLAAYRTSLFEVLEKLTTECDDYYCDGCWSTTHTKGARAKHEWVGFAAGAPVCALCEAAVATRSCAQCNDVLCSRCSEETHASLSFREHEVSILREPLNDATAAHCASCDVRQSVEECTLCGDRLCDSCFQFSHDATCSKRGGAKAIAMGVDVDYPTKCVVCGRRPDSRCVECDEVYCTWMGKPRCFLKQHAKGNRREHSLVAYTALDNIEQRLQKEEDEEARQAQALEAQRAKAALDFQIACENTRRAKEQQARTVDTKADEVLARKLLNDRSRRFAPTRWLRSFLNPKT